MSDQSSQAASDGDQQEPGSYRGSCHDCWVGPGEMHRDGCDVERCPDCGYQLISCGCGPSPTHPRMPWTGEFPGLSECRELGLWSAWVPRGGCPPGRSERFLGELRQGLPRGDGGPEPVEGGVLVEPEDPEVGVKGASWVPMSPRKHAENQMSWPLGLFIDCPVCGRKEGEWCVPTKGRNLGTPHWSRQRLAIESEASERRKRIMSELGCEPTSEPTL